MNPPLVINRNTNFMESDSASSQFDPQKEDVSNDASQVDNDSDPFLTPGSTR